MKLNFKINPDYIFLHALNMVQHQEPFHGWAQFTNKIWEKSPKTFYFLAGSPEYILYGNKKKFSILSKQAEKVLEKTKRNKEYKRLIQETKNYASFVQKQWQRNEKKVLSFVQDVSGIKMPSKALTVYLSHPKLKNGMAIDSNTIVWGHPEEWKNYTTIYLCHELMHILTSHISSDITHAVIELMIDNELRIRLNKKGQYFKENGYEIGHAFLRNLEKKILPYWKNYLKQQDKNILHFVQEIKKIKGLTN